MCWGGVRWGTQCFTGAASKASIRLCEMTMRRFHGTRAGGLDEMEGSMEIMLDLYKRSAKEKRKVL